MTTLTVKYHRFSKKSSLVRHFQNVHDLAKSEMRVEEEILENEGLVDADETECSKMEDRGFCQDLSELEMIPVVPFESSISGESSTVEVQTDVSQAANQFDVEVTYCEDMEDILNVPDDTLFIMDTVDRSLAVETTAVGLAPVDEASVGCHKVEKAPNSENLEKIEKLLDTAPVDVMEAGLVAKTEPENLEEIEKLIMVDSVELEGPAQVKVARQRAEADSENLEDIEKFLEESKGDPGMEESKSPSTSTESKEVRISRDSSYRIPKSPKKGIRTTAHDQKTPHIPFNKEASLRVISVGQNFVKSRTPNCVVALNSKTSLASPKKPSFEEALTGTIVQAFKKTEKPKTVVKMIKVIPACPLPGTSRQKMSSSSSSSSGYSSSTR